MTKTYYIGESVEGTLLAAALLGELTGVVGENHKGEPVSVGDFVNHTQKTMGWGVVGAKDTYQGEPALRVWYPDMGWYAQRCSRTKDVVKGEKAKAMPDMASGYILLCPSEEAIGTGGGVKKKKEEAAPSAYSFAALGLDQLPTKKATPPPAPAPPPVPVTTVDGKGNSITTGDTLLWCGELEVTFLKIGVETEEGNYLVVRTSDGDSVTIDADALVKKGV